MKKTAVITGATSGLGKYTAIDLAKKNYNLIVVGRSEEKGKLLLTELKEINPNIEVFYYTANFSSITDTKNTANEILNNHKSIDVLINNAGGIFSNFGLTEDGYEQTIATNHLGYFVFTLKLLPILNKSEGRIVNVASGSHYKCSLDFDSFTQNKGYFILKAYGQSKLANIMFTYSLVDKLAGTNIKINCLNPGKVKTDIGGKAKSWLHQFAWWFNSRTQGISINDGIKTHVFLATSDEAANINGKYYNNMKLEKTNKESYNKELQDKLWKWSEEATGLKWEEVNL